MKFDYVNEEVDVAKPLSLPYNTSLKWSKNKITETVSTVDTITRFEAPSANSAYHFL